MNIIIIDHEPFSKRKSDHYFVDAFIKQGFEIEYWDVHKALPYLKGVVYQHSEPHEMVRYFNSMNELCNEIIKLPSAETIFILEVWFTYQSVQLFNTLYINNYKWVKIDYYLNPTLCLNNQVSFFEKLKTLHISSLISRIRNYIFLKKYKNSEINVAAVFFVSGKNIDLVPKAKKVVSLDYFDIVAYNSVKKEKPLLDYDYMVFLDTMVVNHPDIKRSGLKKAPLEKEYYYRKMDLFFTFIEKKMGIPVVIASHPKANYDNEYGERLCMKHQTANLATYASLIITHGSLSISYALLEKKPILYLDFKEQFKNSLILSNVQRRIYRAKEMLDAMVVDVEKGPLSFDLSTYSTSKYTKFLEDFYIAESAETNFEILIKNFTQLMKD